MDEQNLDGVKPAADSIATPAIKPAEVVVPEQGNVPAKSADVEKLLEEKNNIHAALKEARGEISELKKNLDLQLAENNKVLGKMKSVFAPDEQPAEQPKALTVEDLNRILDEKEQSRIAENNKKEHEKRLLDEIKSLEQEWDGSDGKPKYIDSEVLNWQIKEGKAGLSPRAAFIEKNMNEIIDWKVKKAKPEIPVINRPGAGGEPSPKVEESTPYQDAGERRAAVLAAMKAALTN